MACRIHWRSSEDASCFHTIQALVDYLPLADAPLALVMQHLSDRFRRLDLPESFWNHLLHHASNIEDDRALARQVVQETADSEANIDALTDRLTHLIREAKQSFLDLHPNVAQDLKLRTRPLRELWEARGPGLLAGIERRLRNRTPPADVKVLLVHPAVGGAGRAHVPLPSVRIEAVLVNPFGDLPEVARLCWLLAQLYRGPEVISGDPNDRLELDDPRAHQLALLPATLAAADDLGLARFNTSTLQLALHQWHLSVPSHVNVIKVLESWWRDVERQLPDWDTAMHSLSRMLA